MYLNQFPIQRSIFRCIEAAGNRSYITSCLKSCICCVFVDRDQEVEHLRESIEQAQSVNSQLTDEFIEHKVSTLADLYKQRCYPLCNLSQIWFK